MQSSRYFGSRIGLRVAMAALVVLIASGCNEGNRPSAEKAESPISSDVLAKVGSTSITRSDFEKEIERRGRRPATDAERQEWLADIVRLEVLYANAMAEGLARDPEIQFALKKMVAGKYFEQRRASNAPPVAGSAEVESYYRANALEFAQPERARFAVIFLKLSQKATEEKWSEMRVRAERIRADAAGQGTQADFGALAQQFSEDIATRYRGGDAGFITSGADAARWPSKVVQAVFALKTPGEISPVVEAPDGLYLLKLSERRPAAVTPLAQVAPLIQNRLNRQALQRAEEEFFMSESKRANVVLIPEALKGIPLSSTGLAQESPPPSVPR